MNFRLSTLTALLIAITFANHAPAAERPNLVFIIADDCTHRDIGCYGGQAHTPHIDRLANEGMRMTQCFQAAPMCSPTRHTIYTGLYPVKSGAYPNHTFVKDGVQSVVHYLKPLGYRVALSGKRHINPPEAFAFEYSAKQNNPDMAVIDTLLGECADSEAPFCLFACSNEPHTPYNKGDASRYPPDEIEIPPYYLDTPNLRQQFSKYLAEITYYDGQVGEILSLLEKHNLAGNTVVMVVSEQGSSFPFAKWTCYDNGLQSAMIIRWPGHIEAGTTSDALVEYVDVLPTFLEAAGGEIPEVLEGRSMLPVFTGKTDTHKEYVFGIQTSRGIHSGPDHYGRRSVRSKDFKLIHNLDPAARFFNGIANEPYFKAWEAKAAAGDERARFLVERYHSPREFELYDVNADSYEETNLADDPEYAKVKAALQAELAGWMQQQGDLGQATEMAAIERMRGGNRMVQEALKKRQQPRRPNRRAP
jgi:N-sulfoglucosamine sulfohydrolase